MKIADSSGEWFVNIGQYRIHDPISDTLFEPGMRTKATPTDWAMGQPTLQAIESPEIPTTPAPAPEVKPKK